MGWVQNILIERERAWTRVYPVAFIPKFLRVANKYPDTPMAINRDYRVAAL